MNPTFISYGALGIAIAAEVIATTLLPHTQEFTKPIPTLGMALLYCVAFYLLTIALRVLPVGIAYAIWSGLGIVLVTTINYFILKQTLDLPAILGLALIIVGVLIINLLSNSVPH
jgi:small multidrug resistance pump